MAFLVFRHNRQEWGPQARLEVVLPQTSTSWGCCDFAQRSYASGRSVWIGNQVHRGEILQLPRINHNPLPWFVGATYHNFRNVTRKFGSHQRHHSWSQGLQIGCRQDVSTHHVHCSTQTTRQIAYWLGEFQLGSLHLSIIRATWSLLAKSLLRLRELASW